MKIMKKNVHIIHIELKWVIFKIHTCRAPSYISPQKQGSKQELAKLQLAIEQQFRFQ